MNLNLTQSFEDFASKMGPMDLALYAGVALVVWVLFKDNIVSTVSPAVKGLKELLSKKYSNDSGVSVPNIDPVVVPKMAASTEKDETFFKLVVSWKQTRDLAQQSGCAEAVKVADQMFPYLSPNVCKKEVS
jgi:hypothetical protein